jgi:hypothetical protein
LKKAKSPNKKAKYKSRRGKIVHCMELFKKYQIAYASSDIATNHPGWEF